MSSDKPTPPPTHFSDFARIGADTSGVTQEAMRLFAAAGSGESNLNTDAQALKQKAMDIMAKYLFPASGGIGYGDMLSAQYYDSKSQPPRQLTDYELHLLNMFIPATYEDTKTDSTNMSTNIYQSAQTAFDSYINTLNRNTGLDTSTTQVMATAGNAVQPLISGLNSFFN